MLNIPPVPPDFPWAKSNFNATSPGVDWATSDRDVTERYSGQYVVAVPGEVVAAGPDRETVRAAAAEKLGIPVEDVMICIIPRPETCVPLSWL
jgi:hypothetical protein